MTARKLAKQKGTWSRMQVIVGGEDVADSEVDVTARAARDRRKHHFIELMIQQKEEQKITPPSQILAVAIPVREPKREVVTSVTMLLADLPIGPRAMLSTNHLKWRPGLYLLKSWFPLSLKLAFEGIDGNCS